MKLKLLTISMALAGIAFVACEKEDPTTQTMNQTIQEREWGEYGVHRTFTGNDCVTPAADCLDDINVVHGSAIATICESIIDNHNNGSSVAVDKEIFIENKEILSKSLFSSKIVDGIISGELTLKIHSKQEIIDPFELNYFEFVNLEGKTTLVYPIKISK
ncbi:MAG: hypothetical protein JXR60_09985 [Bacteroidales bacterium]|nr:hypothetical protein [Bacteroidales bacterium]